MDNLSLKTIWITGASSGIGKALAIQLAALGHKVVISSRSQSKLEEIALSNNGDLIPLACDVTNDVEMESLFQGLDEINHIDCAILCAGICHYIDYPNLDIELIRNVTNTNFIGCANSCSSVLPLLKNSSKAGINDRPHIVGISSMSCFVGFPRAEAYGATKAAMRYFLESLRTDLIHEIDISIVFPGFVSTPMTQQNDFPMPFEISAEEAARRIINKLDKRPYEIIFPRRLYYLLKCLNFVPKLWYGYIAPKLSRAEAVSQ